MAWPATKHIERLITLAEKQLTYLQIVVHDQDTELQRAVIKLEGAWKGYRVIISEVHRADKSVRYAYYIFTQDNQLVQGFDNHGDRTAIKLRYGADWKNHQHEEVPHQHDAARNVTLTAKMTFDTFIEWLKEDFTPL